MKNTLFKISTFLNCCLACVCIWHIVLVIYSALNPKLPNVEITEKNLSDIAFPLREDLKSSKTLCKFKHMTKIIGLWVQSSPFYISKHMVSKAGTRSTSEKRLKVAI